MNKLDQVFSSKGKAFIPFITAGDPSLETTKELIIEMAKSGADLIELGIPFSDPVAEGPAIQAASVRALSEGTTVDDIFDMLKNLRQNCNVPIVFKTYANPIFAYGSDRFFKNCHQTGVDAVIVSDLPFEEKEELLPFCKEYGVTLISTVSTASPKRIQTIVEDAQGFINCVSSAADGHDIIDESGKMVQSVKSVKNIPCVLSHDFLTPEQARQLSSLADGIIIDSAIVKIVEKYGADCVPHVAEYVRMVLSNFVI
jgi:tryptophan synthase alpha chain